MKRYSDLTPEIVELSQLCCKNGYIDPEFYTKYDVKRGLRNKKGIVGNRTVHYVCIWRLHKERC